MKSEELRQTKPEEQPLILERTIAYSIRLVRLYRKLESDSVGRIVGNQLLRAGTSIGANVHEAQGAQSKADFMAKVSIAFKEARECQYWLRLIRELELVPQERLTALADETGQLIKILSAILITSKRRQTKATV